MQLIAPPLGDRNPNGRTEADILSALQGRSGSRRFSFRYELLDAGNVYVQDLVDTVLSCKISYNWLADIKRTASIQLRERGEIDFLSDRIKPYVRLHVPPYDRGDYVEYPQGVFLLSTPKRNSDEQNVITRDVECYDPLQVFIDDKVETRYTAPTGTVYTSAISSLLGAIPKNIAPSTKTLPTAYEAEPGSTKLSIINALLSAINYESLSFDENGVALVRPYRDPTGRAEEYVYGSDDRGLIIPNVDQEIDLFEVANKWVLTVSDPDRPPITATYTNTDPASPTSTIRRQRTIVDFRTEEEAADVSVLAEKVARLAFEASQVYEAIDFSTAMMPIHSGNDVYRINFPALAINAKYTEQTWSFDLRAGASMSHRARRVVTV